MSSANFSFLEQIALPMFVFWGIGLVLSFFRSSIELIWKAFFLLIYFFYFSLFYGEISQGYQRLVNNYPYEIVNYIYGLGKTYFYTLLLLWPLVLIRIYYSASEILSYAIIKALVLATLVYWAGFAIWLVFYKQITYFLETRLVELLRL
ncbi:MAG: hypothetical protein AAF518_11555 [Spirochaetota bacterium]